MCYSSRYREFSFFILNIINVFFYILKWKYHVGNNWGIDPVSNKGCLGCDPRQEQFYGCSDVTIVK
jgi:hypothetical protein